MSLAFVSVLGGKPLDLPPVSIKQFLTPFHLTATMHQTRDRGAASCDGAGTSEGSDDAETMEKPALTDWDGWNARTQRGHYVFVMSAICINLERYRRLTLSSRRD